MKRAKIILCIWCYFFFLVWLGGFIIFQQYIRKHPTDGKTKTDAIVVLTGGKNRITEGVNLYNKGLADMLFISGVGKHTDFKTLQNENHVFLERAEDHAFIGREATNTIENAIEVSDFIRRHHLKKIRLVTSYYHMPRSVSEIKSRHPDLEIIEHPVYSKNVAKRWWKRPKSFYLIASEYHKFIFVYFKNLIKHFY